MFILFVQLRLASFTPSLWAGSFWHQKRNYKYSKLCLSLACLIVCPDEIHYSVNKIQFACYTSITTQRYFSCWKCYIFSVSCFNVFGDFIWRFSSPTNNAGFIGNYISHLHRLFIQCLNLCLNYSILACHQDKVNMKVDYSCSITINYAEFYCFLGPFNQWVWLMSLLPLSPSFKCNMSFDIFLTHYHLCTSVFRTWFIKFVWLHNLSGIYIFLFFNSSS